MIDDLLQSVIDEGESIVYLKRVDGCYLMVNRRFETYAGRQRGAVVGRTDAQLFSASLARDLLGLDQEALIARAPVRAERRLDFQDAERVFWCNVFPLRTKDAAIYAVCGILSDVTDASVRERDREEMLLSEHAVREAAERAVRGKDQFLSLLSHELRTPLNAMVGWLHILHTPALDPALQVRALQGMTRSVDRQRRLVDDLLDTARLMTGRLTLERRMFAVEPAVRAAAAQFDEAARTSAVRLEIHSGVPAAMAIGDSGRFGQALVRLIDNAMKFTPSGGIVSIDLSREGAHVLVRVVDNGAGIEPALLAQLFEPFEPSEEPITRRHGGLGVGLSLVKQLIELQGGTIEATSPGLGLGASFSIRLPCAEASNESLPAVEMNGTGTADRHGESMTLHGVRILAVDDQAEMRDVLATLLARWGARVELVASATDARERYVRWARGPGERLIISDIAMPDEDGKSLIASIRELERAHHLQRVPAVALSAHSDSDDREAALRAGFDTFVSKPIDPPTFNIILAQMAGR